MNHEDRKIFSAMMSSMSHFFNDKLTAEVIEIYWQVLQEFTLAEIQRALNLHLRDPERGQFKPKPSELIRHITGIPSMQALHAWTKLSKAIRQLGSHVSVVFDDPLIHAVIEDMGGWIYLCREKEETLYFRQKEFEKRYCHYTVHKPAYYPNRLVGVMEHQNQLMRLPVGLPIYVGNIALAKQVYQGGSKHIPANDAAMACV